MKKMVKSLLALVFAATLFIMPASTALAATIPVVVHNSNGIVQIEFEPDPFFLSPGYAIELINYVDNTRDWYVPAGKSFLFSAHTDEMNTVARVQVYKNGSLIYDQASSSSTYGYTLQFPAESTGNRYRVIITALQNMNVGGYVVWIS